jgi:hypothetical protein
MELDVQSIFHFSFFIFILKLFFRRSDREHMKTFLHD